MSDNKKYELRSDNGGRFVTELSDEISCAMKLFSETDPQRIEYDVHAYAILDIRTAVRSLEGKLLPIVFRGRNIRIRWSKRNEQFYIHWHQWNTGRKRRDSDKPERMDVFGPLDRQSREIVNELIIAMFTQIREEAQAGTLGRANPELKELKAKLETAEAAKQTGAGDESEDDLADAVEAQLGT